MLKQIRNEVVPIQTMFSTHIKLYVLKHYIIHIKGCIGVVEILNYKYKELHFFYWRWLLKIYCVLIYFIY